jgi:hypothetical protein
MVKAIGASLLRELLLPELLLPELLLPELLLPELLLRGLLHAATLNNSGAVRMMAIANTTGVLIDVSLSGAHQE